MSTSMTLLSLLEPEPAYGYTLKHRFDEIHGNRRPLAFGQVYSSLARFERQGLAELSDVKSGEGPDRKLYRITSTGVDRIDAWVYGTQDADQFASSDLFSRLAVAILSGRSAQRVLDEQRVVHLERMRQLQRTRQGSDALGILALTYELAHLDADLRWMDDSVARISAATPETDRDLR